MESGSKARVSLDTVQERCPNYTGKDNINNSKLLDKVYVDTFDSIINKCRDICVIIRKYCLCDV